MGLLNNLLQFAAPMLAALSVVLLYAQRDDPTVVTSTTIARRAFSKVVVPFLTQASANRSIVDVQLFQEQSDELPTKRRSDARLNGKACPVTTAVTLPRILRSLAQGRRRLQSTCRGGLVLQQSLFATQPPPGTVYAARDSR
jgi:hypothetical protein